MRLVAGDKSAAMLKSSRGDEKDIGVEESRIQ